MQGTREEKARSSQGSARLQAVRPESLDRKWQKNNPDAFLHPSIFLSK